MEDFQDPFPILRTKLHPPFIRIGLIDRPRLRQQIIQGLTYPLTLIIAPAGFGKTTLAVSCIAGSQKPVAWISLDQSDNQTGYFLRYLIAALQTVDEKIGLEAGRIMDSIQQASHQSVLVSLVNDIASAGKDIVLLLDDYQLITNQVVHEDLAFLIEHCPHNFHLLIATRSDPPLPMARLRAGGQVVELRATDLRFTRFEASQFLNDVMGLYLGSKSTEILEQRTEGWIAGLQMAALSIRGCKDITTFIERFSGSNRYIMDYLLEEVMAGQTPEVQHFLLVTSILNSLSAPLCDVLIHRFNQEQGGIRSGETSAKNASSEIILEYLERNNLFLISLDESGLWYRYHHLFADLLQARMKQAYPGLISSLHREAAGWLALNGHFTQAIQHFFTAGDNERAADLIENNGPKRWLENDSSVILMADRLPQSLLTARPKLSLYRIWLSIIQGEIPRALTLLHDTKQVLSQMEPANENPWITTIINLAYAFLNPDPQNIPALPQPQALEKIPSDELIFRDAANILYGMTLGRRGELDLAAETSIHFIDNEKKLYRNLTIPTLVSFLARILLMQGKLHAAAALCNQYLDPIREKGFRYIYSAGSLHIVLGEVFYEWNRLQEAEEQIREGVLANEPWEDIMTRSFSLLALTRLLCTKKDEPEALEAAGKFEVGRLKRLSPIEFQEDYRTLIVNVKLALGKVEEAGQWADYILLDNDYRQHPEFYQLTLARIRLAEGKYKEAEELLANDVTKSESGNMVTRLIEFHLLLAASKAGQGRMPEALESVKNSLALAEPEGYIRIFLDIGEAARNLLSAYVRTDDGPHKAYAQKLLDLFSLGGFSDNFDTTISGLLEPLSSRELEVLNLMALGMTNQEIARRLIVASGTIKAHAASIYRKLDAANRTEAVTRARKMGILE